MPSNYNTKENLDTNYLLGVTLSLYLLTSFSISSRQAHIGSSNHNLMAVNLHTIMTNS